MDYFQTRIEIEERKDRLNQDPAELLAFEALEKDQKRIFNFFYDKFKQKRLINRIVASYEMRSVYLEYCPPLVPQQVLQ